MDIIISSKQIMTLYVCIKQNRYWNRQEITSANPFRCDVRYCSLLKLSFFNHWNVFDDFCGLSSRSSANIFVSQIYKHLTLADSFLGGRKVRCLFKTIRLTLHSISQQVLWVRDYLKISPHNAGSCIKLKFNLREWFRALSYTNNVGSCIKLKFNWKE